MFFKSIDKVIKFWYIILDLVTLNGKGSYLLKIGLLTGISSALTIPAFADTPLTGVTGIISSASADVIASATPVITAAVGVGVVFWGAKLLWGKFKSMAK